MPLSVDLHIPPGHLHPPSVTTHPPVLAATTFEVQGAVDQPGTQIDF